MSGFGMGRWVDGSTDGEMNGREWEGGCMGRWMFGCRNAWVLGWVDEWGVDVWMDAWVRMDRCTHGLVGEWMDDSLLSL